MPTQGHCPFNLAEPPSWLGLQALHAHTKYTAGVQLCLGVSFHPKSQIGAVYAHAEATQALQWRREAVRSNPAARGDTPSWTPHLYVLAQRVHWNSRYFFPKICSTPVSSDFHTIGPFPKSCHFSSKWNHLWRIKALLALKWLIIIHMQLLSCMRWGGEWTALKRKR